MELPKGEKKNFKQLFGSGRDDDEDQEKKRPSQLGSGHGHYRDEDAVEGAIDEETAALCAKVGAHWADADASDHKDRHVTGHNQPQNKMGRKTKRHVENNSLIPELRDQKKEDPLGFKRDIHSFKEGKGYKGASLDADEQLEMLNQGARTNRATPAPVITTPTPTPTQAQAQAQTPTPTQTPTPKPKDDFYTSFFANMPKGGNNQNNKEDDFW